jgi:hypothetical protein
MIELFFCPIHGIVPNFIRFGMMFWLDLQLWYIRIRGTIGGFL